jgi:hypothetical protein
MYGNPAEHCRENGSPGPARPETLWTPSVTGAPPGIEAVGRRPQDPNVEPRVRQAGHHLGSVAPGSFEPAHLETLRTPMVAGAAPGAAVVGGWSQNPNIEPLQVSSANPIQQWLIRPTGSRYLQRFKSPSGQKWRT